MRFSPESTDPSNAGLSIIRDLLHPVKVSSHNPRKCTAFSNSVTQLRYPNFIRCGRLTTRRFPTLICGRSLDALELSFLVAPRYILLIDAFLPFALQKRAEHRVHGDSARL